MSHSDRSCAWSWHRRAARVAHERTTGSCPDGYCFHPPLRASPPARCWLHREITCVPLHRVLAPQWSFFERPSQFLQGPAHRSPADRRASVLVPKLGMPIHRRVVMLAHLLGQDRQQLRRKLSTLSLLDRGPAMSQPFVAGDVAFDRAKAHVVFCRDPRRFMPVLPATDDPFPQIVRIPYHVCSPKRFFPILAHSP